MSVVTLPEFSCKKVSGGRAEGTVLVSKDDICFFLTDPKTAVLLEDQHDLNGLSLADKVLVFPSGKGSAVVQDEGLFALQENGNLPAAMIIQNPDTVLVFGALLLKIPVVHQADPEFYKYARAGRRVMVDAELGKIALLEI